MKNSIKMKPPAKSANLKQLLSVRIKNKTDQKKTTTLNKNVAMETAIAARLARAAGMKHGSKSDSSTPPAKDLSALSASHSRTPERGTDTTRLSSVERNNRKVTSSGAGARAPFVDDEGVPTAPKPTRRCLFVESEAESDLSKKDDAIAVALANQEKQNKKPFRSSNRDKYAHLLRGKRIVPQPAPQEVGASGVIDETKSRYRYLLDKDKRSLQLPFKYQILLAKFLALETVIMIQQHCQRKTVTFDSACPSVERTCSKQFTMEDLARMMTVFPKAYELTVIYRNGRSPGGPGGTIEGYHSGKSSLRIAADFGNDLEVDARMAERKEAFTVSLMDICKAAHKHFLGKIGSPAATDDEEITDWHPDFQLDNVPEIKMAELPSTQRAPVPSAADILNRTPDMSTAVKRALEHVVAKQSIPASPIKKRRVEDGTQVKSDLQPEPVQSAPLTLRERIRLKERLKKEEKMREEAAEAKGGTKNAKTQWECACIMRSYGLSKRKNALPLADSIIAIRRCLKTPINEERIKKTLVELTDVVPAWCQIKKVQKKNYFSMKPEEFQGTQKYFASRIKM